MRTVILYSSKNPHAPQPHTANPEHFRSYVPCGSQGQIFIRAQVVDVPLDKALEMATPLSDEVVLNTVEYTSI